MENKIRNIKLQKPELKDLWFRKECMSDEATMAYNAGYNVNFAGYHYNTGCIDFPEENWAEWFETKMKNPNFFYAYIVDEIIGKFVGYVNFNKNAETGKATMGIVIKSEFQGRGYMRPAMKLLIEEARNAGVKFLTDTVPETRTNALRVFYDLGFKKIAEIEGTKFNNKEIIAEIELDLT